MQLQPLISRLGGVCLLLVVAQVGQAAPSSHRAKEPTEKELKAAYAEQVRKTLATEGNLNDSNCRIDGKGCTVSLLDMRRSYQLSSFHKRSCYPETGGDFVCSFDAHLHCTYFSSGRAQPYVADLYCGPLANKTSTYTASLFWHRNTWVIRKFVQG